MLWYRKFLLTKASKIINFIAIINNPTDRIAAECDPPVSYSKKIAHVNVLNLSNETAPKSLKV